MVTISLLSTSLFKSSTGKLLQPLKSPFSIASLFTGLGLVRMDDNFLFDSIVEKSNVVETGPKMDDNVFSTSDLKS